MVNVEGVYYAGLERLDWGDRVTYKICWMCYGSMEENKIKCVKAWAPNNNNKYSMRFSECPFAEWQEERKKEKVKG